MESIVVEFVLPDDGLERLKNEIRSGRISAPSEVKNFGLWGELAIRIDGRDLFSPPIWPQRRSAIGQSAEAGLLDFFVSMEEIMRAAGDLSEDEAAALLPVSFSAKPSGRVCTPSTTSTWERSSTVW